MENKHKQPNRPGGPMGGHGMVMAGARAKDFKGSFRRLLSYLNPARTKLIIIFILAALSTIFAVASPKILGAATNTIAAGVVNMAKGTGSIDFNALLTILMWLAGFYILSAFFSYLQQYLMADVAQNTVFKLRTDVHEKLSRLPLKYFDSHSNGDLLSTVTNDVDNISNTLQQSITQLITSVVTLIGVTIMMFSISWILTLIILITLPLGIFVIRPIVGRSQTHFSAQQNALGDLNGHIEEMYTGHLVVKAFGHEKESIEHFTCINDSLYESGWKAQFVSGLVMPLMGLVNNIGYVVVAVVGGVLAVSGRLLIGDIQAFIQYSRQFTQPINQLANIANILQSTIASAERVFAILDEEESVPEATNPVTIKNPKGEVVFDHVSFGYTPDHLLMKDLNITVKPGQTIAIVGPTGAGKTTMINLLMRFYELNGGEIRVDGVDITDLTRKDLRQLFGMVLQDTWLFKGSIRDNIAYGKENATFEEVVEVAKAAHADHFIRTLPQGYDTILNEEASNISQGQKQLLTIARAILANPSILILDEATSSVDTRTEHYIQNAMTRLMEGRTNFVIAHRLSTIKDADVILVMKAGNVVEQGTHDELLAKGGIYADLYNSQFDQSA
ncbi:ABC transporter ATP-binding protein [Niameybacter massiliensis]|uniref:ABC transporter ATP-binding protein n=1 Tax=Holtiella tumoricola TaxID=3018743 RepID=A0AA42DNZ3_9FIRM|nr:ABC transporter ATP-binding protein [Holtiella tumoricola]MDA3732206.1 ABC transporter ATP-binding protein [Holtiella tumoricola]